MTFWKSRVKRVKRPAGKTSRIVESTVNRPSSTRMPIKVAVMALVQEPRWTWSVTGIGSDEPILRMPTAPIAASRSPVRMAPIRPGRWCSSRIGSRISLTR